MEGRDSMQLIYRWTKSLDPSLRKGLWDSLIYSQLLSRTGNNLDFVTVILSWRQSSEPLVFRAQVTGWTCNWCVR